MRCHVVSCPSRPDFDDDEDLPLPVFPPTHSSSNSFDSVSGSPGGTPGSYSKRSASPFMRKKKPRADSTESSSARSAFAFPHPSSPASSTGQGGGTHYTKTSDHYSAQQTPSRPTFKQRSASSTQPNLNSHIAHSSPISVVPGSASSTSFFTNSGQNQYAAPPPPSSASLAGGYAGFANLPAAGDRKSVV